MNKPNYRAKALETCEWVYGTLFYWDENATHLQAPDGTHIAIYYDTLSQATGYKDRHGRDIYEGDIIAHFRDNPQDGQEVTLIGITQLASGNSEEYNGQDILPYHVVIDNRFDTPEWEFLYTPQGRKQALREQRREQVDQVISQSRMDDRLVNFDRWLHFQNCQHEENSKKLFRAELADLFIDIYSAGYAEGAEDERAEALQVQETNIRDAYREGYNDCKTAKTTATRCLTHQALQSTTPNERQ